MPILTTHNHQISYELIGEPDQPVITFLNGLTQNARLWTAYADHFVPRGYRVLVYDMLGQGRSSKPVIEIPFSCHAELLDELLGQLEIEKTHLVSISFGGIIALDFAIRFGNRLHSLVAMSTFAELTAQLELLGAVMLQGLTDVGLPYLQSMLYPMNMSSAWLEANRERIPAMKRAGYIGNDGYAMQNLMESFVSFKPLTSDLHKIGVPTLIINGEFDFFTPRECHEIIRSRVSNSKLVIMPRAYHAFTLEMPELTMRQLDVFLNQIDEDRWQGDQSVWLANEDLSSAETWLPIYGDWMRAVQSPRLAAPDVKPTIRSKSPSRRKAS